MPDPTIIIALTAAGLIVEAPGANGMRAKIEGLTLDDLPFEMRAALIEQRDRLRAAPKPTQAPKAEYVDPQIERERRAQEAGQRRLAERRVWIDSLSEPQRAYEQEKLDKALTRAEEEHNARARAIYKNIINEHRDMDLANRVITDPNRRPKNLVREATANGIKLVSPRTGKIYNQNKSYKTGPKFRGDKNGTAVKIEL